MCVWRSASKMRSDHYDAATSTARRSRPPSAQPLSRPMPLLGFGAINSKKLEGACPNGMHHTTDADAAAQGHEVAVFALG